MPPSSRHRHSRSAHDVFVRYYTQHSKTTLTDDLEGNQALVALPPEPNIVARKQTVPSHNSAVVVVLISLLVIAILIGSILFFLFHYRRKLKHAIPDLSPQTAGSKSGFGTVLLEKNGLFPNWMKKERRSNARFILHQGKGGLVISQTPPSNLKGILMAPKEYLAHEIDEKEAWNEEEAHAELFKNEYQIPTMAFEQMLPSAYAPCSSANRSAQLTYDDTNAYIVDGGINIIVSEDLSGSSSGDSSVYSRASRRSDFTIAEYQLSQRSLSSTGDKSIGPITPDQDSFEPQVQISSQDILIVENQSSEFLSKLRGLIPKPPSAKFSAFTTSPFGRVRRSSTAPAFFTIVSPNSKRSSIASLKPSSSRERESVTSNFIFRLIESQVRNERSLLDEAFPPPTIIVSPPTASTIVSSINRHSLLGAEGDVWYQAYRMHVAGEENLVEVPPKYNLELSKKGGGVGAPPRPARSPKRTSMQSLADKTEPL